MPRERNSDIVATATRCTTRSAECQAGKPTLAPSLDCNPSLKLFPVRANKRLLQTLQTPWGYEVHNTRGMHMPSGQGVLPKIRVVINVNIDIEV